MRSSLSTASTLLAGLGLAAGAQLGSNTTCPKVMVLAARETTAPPGFGSTNTLVGLILQAFPGASAAQSIEYPAAGGNNQGMWSMRILGHRHGQECGER